MLKYGFDLNNEFSNDFAPATEENDCSFTVTSNIYQSMTTPGNTAIGGGVAQSWTISNNGSTVTFHIRPGLEFSNGQPVTSADVAASLNNTKTSPLRSSLFNISSIETPNPSTVVVNLSKPTAGDFLWASSYIDGQIYPADAISTQSSQPVGAGPFVLKSYQQGSSIVLAKNPKYWDSKAYPLGGIDFTQVTQGPEAATALTSGAVDMIEVEPENYPQLKSDPNIGISITKSYDYMDDRAAPEHGTLRQREGAGGARVRRRPGRAEQGRLRRSRRAGVPSGAVVVAGVLQVARRLRRLQPRQGQGHAQGGRLPQGREFHADHPVG